MVEVILNLPDDFGWIIKNKDGLKWVKSAIINRLSEVKIGNLIAKKSVLKETDIDELYHIIKDSLYKRIKAEQ